VTGRLVSVNAGRAHDVPWGGMKRSAIDKRPVEGPARVHRLGLDGDEQADTKHHGGVDQAVYAVAREDLDRWVAHLERALAPGSFGENLTTSGVDVTDAVVGERWRVGSVLLEVSCPRIPCSVFAGWMDERRWVRRFTEEGRPGAYLRVAEEGTLAAGDAVEVVLRPDHGLTIGETFRALTGDRALVPRLLDAPELPEESHAYARRILASGTRGAGSA
jgi:MOSC domain-containing protein YiiM